MPLTYHNLKHPLQDCTHQIDNFQNLMFIGQYIIVMVEE